MLIKANRLSLLSAFQMASAVAPKKHPKPILSNVRLEANEIGVTMEATDLETSIKTIASIMDEDDDIEVDSPGVALLPVQQFRSLLRDSSDNELTIESEDGQVRINGEYSEIRLQSASPEEFPETTFNERAYHKIPARLFCEMIRLTSFATDDSSTRYSLGGVLLEMDDSQVVAVGTDGRRLAKMEGLAESVQGHKTKELQTIVPNQSLQVMQRCISYASNDDDVIVSCSSNSILIRIHRAVIQSRLIEGRFPEWKKIFPDSSNAIQVDLVAGDFLSAIRQAAVVASSETRGLEFLFDDGVLAISASTAEIGESKVELPIAYNDEAVKVRLDYKLVTDFLKVLCAETDVTVDLIDDQTAVRFSTDNGYEYVVMPMA